MMENGQRKTVHNSGLEKWQFSAMKTKLLIKR